MRRFAALPLLLALLVPPVELVLLLGLLFLASCSTGTAPSASANEADLAFGSAIVAASSYVHHHPGSGPLVADRCSKIAAALKSESTWGTIRLLVQDAVTDPVDGALVAVVLRIADRNAPDPTARVTKGSQAAAVIRSSVDGCLLGVAQAGGR